MQQLRVGGWVEQFVLGSAVMLFAAGCAAQEPKIQTCGTGCVEVLLRYYEQPQKTESYDEPSKIQILDSKTRQVIGNPCRICDPKVDPTCKNACPELNKQTLQDASQIILLQTHKNPTCYYICSGGWCRWFCF